MPNRSGLQGSGPLPPLHMGEAEDGRRGCYGEDLISGLPDEVLHAILVRLDSARAAARTSVLSRRWRRVWVHMPEIRLDAGLEARPPPLASFLDVVDGALGSCLAPALEYLRIALPTDYDIPVPAGRVAPWLRFAAERVAGELSLFAQSYVPPVAKLELPVCGGAKTIKLYAYPHIRLRLQPKGLFKALTKLVICGYMEGSELTTLVCTQCPRLNSLDLSGTLVALADVSLLSDSLHSLSYMVCNTQRLEVVAPRLEELDLFPSTDEDPILISAPKLGKLSWHGTYDPSYHRFSDVSRHLLLLEISDFSQAESLIRQFDEVDVLKLNLEFSIQGVVRYQSFLDDIKNLSKCKTLSVTFLPGHHGLTPAILHLFRSCNRMRKFSVTMVDDEKDPCPSSCPCRSEDSRRIDDIDLGSLEEVEISSFKISHEELEFVEVLSRCNATILKKLVISYMEPDTLEEAKEVCEKVRSTCRPTVDVEFYVFPDGPKGRRECLTDYLMLMKNLM